MVTGAGCPSYAQQKGRSLQQRSPGQQASDCGREAGKRDKNRRLVGCERMTMATVHFVEIGLLTRELMNG